MSDPRPSIVFLNRVYPPVRGATGRVLQDLVQAFEAEGWDVRVISAQDIPDKSAWRYAIIWCQLLFRGLFMRKADVIVTMTDPPMLIVAGRMIAALRGMKHMHWCQDLYPELFPVIGLDLPDFVIQSMKTLSRKSMRRCHKVVAVGRCMAKHLTHSGVDPARVAVIPNWPDFELFESDKSHKPIKPFLVRNKKNIRPAEEQVRDENPKFRVLYAGNIGRAHAMQSIIEAAVRLQEYKEIEFCFVGNGQGHETLARERDKRGLENIKLLPYQPVSRLRKTLERGDLHLISMHEEAAGYVVPCKLYSALAIGRPCLFVGPEESEITQIIKDFKAGERVSPDNPDAIAAAILSFRQDEKTWFDAQKGAIEAGKIFTPNQSISEWMKRAQTVMEEMEY